MSKSDTSLVHTRPKTSKRERRLEARQADFDDNVKGKVPFRPPRVQHRIDNGGFRRPGSQSR